MTSKYDFIDEIESQYTNLPSYIEETERAHEKGSLRLKDASRQVPIGATLGLGAYGNLLDLIRAQPKENLLPGQEAIFKSESEAPEKYLPFLQDEDILPHYSRLPSSANIEEFLQTMGVDTEPYTSAGRTSRRISQGVGSTLATAPIPGLVGASALGGAVGGLTAELTDSELTGDVAEIATNITAIMKQGPAAIGKRGEKIRALENIGFSRAEQTLLSQGEGKLEFLGKLASKDRKMSNLFSKIYKTHGNLYDGIRAASNEFGYLSGTKGENLLNSIFDNFGDLSFELQKLSRPLVEDFTSKPFTFKSMMDFIQDLNLKFGGLTGGKKAILKLKTPVVQGMKDLNLEGGQLFEELQSSYGNFKKIAKTLKPKNIDDLLDASEIIAGAKALIDKKPSFLLNILGFTGVRKLAREYLINPDLQGIMIRISKAVQEGKMPLAENLARKLPNYFSKETGEDTTLQQ